MSENNSEARGAALAGLVSEMLNIYSVRFTDPTSREVAVTTWAQQFAALLAAGAPHSIHESRRSDGDGPLSERQANETTGEPQGSTNRTPLGPGSNPGDSLSTRAAGAVPPAKSAELDGAELIAEIVYDGRGERVEYRKSAAGAVPEDGGVAETERRHSVACREQEAQRTREAEALAAGFTLGKASREVPAQPIGDLEAFGREEQDAALAREDRDMYQFYAGWLRALQSLQPLPAGPPEAGPAHKEQP